MLPRLLILFFVVVAALTAQSPAPSTQKPNQAETFASDHDAEKAAVLWRERAERLTNSVLEDEWLIGPWSSVLHARLAEAWWKADPVRANQWLQEAYAEVTFERKNEPEDQRKERLKAGTSVFYVINKLDPKMADRLLKFLSAEAKKAPEAIQQQTAQSLQMALSQSVMDSVDSDNTGRAEELANAALEIPGNQELAQIMSTLGYRDPAVRDRFYLKALRLAVANHDYTMVFGLIQYPFAYFDSPGKASDAIRQQTIDLVGPMLARIPEDEEQRKQYCLSAAGMARHLLPELPAAQQGLVQAAIQGCQADSPEANAEDSDQCKTADDCLKLAATAATPKASAHWKELATFRAETEKNSARSLEILNSFTEEEKEALPAWKTNYTNFAYQAFSELRKHHDTDRIQQVIDRAPDDLRAQVILQYAGTLLSGKDREAETPYAIVLLTEARRVLEKTPANNPAAYLHLLMLYQAVLPSEAPQVFGFITEGLNQIHYVDRAHAKEGEIFYHPPGQFLDFIPVRSSLLATDESYILASLKTLDNPKSRIAFRLGFLNASLKSYEEELHKKNAPSAKPAVKDLKATR